MIEERVTTEKFNLPSALGVINKDESQWLFNYLIATIGIDKVNASNLVNGNKMWKQSTAPNDPQEKQFRRMKSALTSRRNRKKKKQNKVAISAWLDPSTRREFDQFMASKGYLLSDGLDSIIKMGIDNFREYYEDEIQKHKEHIKEEYEKRLESAKDLNKTQRVRENLSMKRIIKSVTENFIKRYPAKTIARGVALQPLWKQLETIIERELDENDLDNFKGVADAVEDSIVKMYDSVGKLRNLQKASSLGELDDDKKSSKELAKKAKNAEKKLENERRRLDSSSWVVFRILCHFVKLSKKEMTYDQKQFRHGCRFKAVA